MERTDECITDEIHNFVNESQNVNMLEVKISKYNELLMESENKIHQIIAGLSISENEEKKYYYETLREALINYFSIKETDFKKVMRDSLTWYKRSTPIEKSHVLEKITPLCCPCSYELTRDLLRNEQITLKIFQKLYPLDDPDRLASRADVQNLMYVLNDVSPKHRDKIFCIDNPEYLIFDASEVKKAL